MPKVKIDGVELEVPAGLTVLQACELAGVEIPRFCYHDRLSIAGNCRMCLVEVKPGPPKPQASCALPVADKQEIFTQTPTVQKARKGVMEFLLINHPLDCPICDQGGECDLQDQAMAYGFDRSRYHENKRAVPDKELGPLVKTSMNRCIHCTRCIRFATEVAGVEQLGATGRGESMEVTTYVEQALATELSGNLVDLCPVGALTSKPYAFEARSWELTKTESVDVLDALGSNIRIDTRGAQVMRILPRLNDDVNEEWISDKTRHALDGLRHQRLDRPYVRTKGKLVEATWDEAFAAIAARLNGLEGSKIAAIAGDQCDAESMVALKDLMASLGSPNIDCRQDGARLDGPRGSYIFNAGVRGIDQAEAILLIGTNPRTESPVLNARIRKRYVHGNVAIASIGPAEDLTYPVERLGAGPATLRELVDGRLGFFEKLKGAKHPLIVVGMGALAREDGAAVLAMARELAEKLNAVREDWNGFAVLHTAAARVGGLDLGLVPGQDGRDVAGILEGCQKKEIEAVYLLAADEIDTTKLGKAFVIYQGHHGDAGAHRADVILPGAAYTEKPGIYVNTEGRVQIGRRAGYPPGDAREDWAILRALSERLGKTLPYDTLHQVRSRLVAVNKVFAAIDQQAPAAWGTFGTPGAISDAPFKSAVPNFYMTCPISRASKTMADCMASRAHLMAAE
ncbi:MAG: NADH-quinone oxidoreductase subunit G [Reyranella sp.]|uniref:NADH-quinone oxidoreductase subunit NuoG n=1 Tax=Reyranella sp. TaxID=1929291 RepID=UPI00121315E7|nr:NADH-quinone oxidoreductase subunit NuoG [Reyranella sp.]TAJ86869.1 MAG: NADH-quinone oxidoreductase subunit G [Reyranella sp.]TBR27735.1 MAG: NADH-quinone oxidoreductase subunit G [Reyranella sp.]